MDTKNEPEGLADKIGGQVAEAQEEKKEMCCDGQQTAEQHRHDSPDGKCCIDK
jgi:hypothetical protein